MQNAKRAFLLYANCNSLHKHICHTTLQPVTKHECLRHLCCFQIYHHEMLSFAVNLDWNGGEGRNRQINLDFEQENNGFYNLHKLPLSSLFRAFTCPLLTLLLTVNKSKKLIKNKSQSLYLAHYWFILLWELPIVCEIPQVVLY